MESTRPWLAQGDVFSKIPVLDLALQGQALAASLPQGPAVLLTHDCGMDKCNADGTPKLERLQFAPVRSISALPKDRVGNLRAAKDKVAPFEALWLGDLGVLGESFLLLSEPYFLPSEYFGTRCVQYEEAADDGSNAPRGTPLVEDSRIGKIPGDRLTFLRRKMIAYWTRFDPGDIAL